jgi:hypothetical protein
MNDRSTIPFGILVSFWMHRRLLAPRHVPFPFKQCTLVALE